MSKILITGMSAPHASKSANERTLSFAGVIANVLISQGHEVTQTDPEVSWNMKDLEKYDSVLVGISPLTSLSANRVYGALSVIDIAQEIGNLTLFIDAPEPVRITSSLRALSKTPDNIVKPFYSYRKGFTHATQPSVLNDLLGVIERLLNDTWPITLYPSMPWDEGIEKVSAQLPEGAAKSLRGINLDAYLLDKLNEVEYLPKEKWVVDNYSSPWSKKIVNSLQKPTSPMRWNKGWTDSQVLSQISRSIGALINPHQTGGLWWTYRFIQCLNAETPIVTEWREAGRLGDSWSYLAAKIEEMSPEERKGISQQQYKSYANAIPNKRDAAIELSNAINLYAGKE